jgi:iron complex transport system substrate-binding protein
VIGRRALLAGIASVVACRKSTAGTPAPIATRIVSISPSTTETLFVIGAGDRVVGRSRYCDWPAEVTKLPQVGGYIDPSFEAILALRPDLVTGARGPAGDVLTRRLEARGVATYFPKTESFAGIEEMIGGLGTRTGRSNAALDTVTKLHARLEEIRAKYTNDAQPPRVLLVFGLDPLAVAGPGSFADEMITWAGGKNAVDKGGAYPTIGVEHVLTLNPDVIVNAAIAESHGKERIASDTPGWSRVPAVRGGHVRAISDESVLRPGPRIAEGLATLEQAIHDGIVAPEPLRKK